MAVFRTSWLFSASTLLALGIVLAACGNGTSSEDITGGEGRANTVAPYGIASVTWPADETTVTTMMARLPDELSGEQRLDLPLHEGTSYAAQYTGGGLRHGLYANEVAADSNVRADLLALGAWAGVPGGCVDATYSSDLAPLFEAKPAGMQREWESLAASAAPDDSWFECTSVVDMENGGRLDPQDYQYLLAWTVGDHWTYAVTAGSVEQRSDMVAALTKAAGD